MTDIGLTVVLLIVLALACCPSASDRQTGDAWKRTLDNADERRKQ